MSSVIEQFLTQIRHAMANGHKLRIHGGNSKYFYGEAAASAQVLDTRAHTGVVSYEPSELVVTVRAGTPLSELEALLAEQGQCLAFEPPRYKAANDQHSQAKEKKNGRESLRSFSRSNRMSHSLHLLWG
jgi:glycolate oxidase FAD binding subunit